MIAALEVGKLVDDKRRALAIVQALPERKWDDQPRAPAKHQSIGESLAVVHQTLGGRSSPRLIASSSTHSWISSAAG